MNISRSRQVDPFNIDASHYFLKNFACDVYRGRGRQQESLIQRHFWESDMKLNLFWEPDMKFNLFWESDMKLNLFSQDLLDFHAYDELCD